ncbi:hypothetical protein sscle_09g068960 [Sclerotinia sclerotiorum 1980 UF-70]|nr:hypothetical protein sscle_09g068960 [Sclerotinia sclerotiorum 1980 UF-70]
MFMEKLGLTKEKFVSTDDLKEKMGGATETIAELSESSPLFDFDKRDKRILTPAHPL